MSKFTVGQQVRIIDGFDLCFLLELGGKTIRIKTKCPAGVVGRIQEIIPDGTYRVSLASNLTGEKYFIYAEQMEIFEGHLPGEEPDPRNDIDGPGYGNKSLT